MKTMFVVEADSEQFTVFLWSLKQDDKGKYNLDDCLFANSNRAQVYGVLDALLVSRQTLAEAKPIEPIVGTWPDNVLRMKPL
jgi:hypothetical protein